MARGPPSCVGVRWLAWRRLAAEGGTLLCFAAPPQQRRLGSPRVDHATPVPRLVRAGDVQDEHRVAAHADVPKSQTRARQVQRASAFDAGSGLPLHQVQVPHLFVDLHATMFEHVQIGTQMCRNVPECAKMHIQTHFKHKRTLLHISNIHAHPHTHTGAHAQGGEHLPAG